MRAVFVKTDFFFYSAFEHPNPPTRLVLDSVSALIYHLQRSLRAGTIRRNEVSLDMNTEVFRFLFDGKGTESESGYKEYNLSDFDTKYFVDEWYVNYDKLGDGCAIDFPLKMKSCIKWNREYYRMHDKTLVPSARKVFSERIYLFVVKKCV